MSPKMYVVAGPAGSGKSIVFPVSDTGLDHFNVDDRCAELNAGSYVAISPDVRRQAQEECEAFIKDHIASGTSFAVETTLRSDIAIRQAQEAREHGFATVML